MISPSCCPPRPHEPERPDPPRRSWPPSFYTTSRGTTREPELRMRSGSYYFQCRTLATLALAGRCGGVRSASSAATRFSRLFKNPINQCTPTTTPVLEREPSFVVSPSGPRCSAPASASQVGTSPSTATISSKLRASSNTSVIQEVRLLMPIPAAAFYPQTVLSLRKLFNHRLCNPGESAWARVASQ